MTLWQLLGHLRPTVPPTGHGCASLGLTLVASLIAQVNALTLQYAVDRINRLLQSGQHLYLSHGLRMLIAISVILLGQKIVNNVVQFGQTFDGECLRIWV